MFLGGHYSLIVTSLSGQENLPILAAALTKCTFWSEDFKCTFRSHYFFLWAIDYHYV